jgi:hypothetical protein
MHSPLGPSKADIFLNCPGYARLEAPEEDHTDEPDYLREGIIAHEIAAKCLKTDTDAWEYIGLDYPYFDSSQASAVQQYLDYVREGRGGNLLKIEHLLGEGLFMGTPDCTWINGRWATIVDYKHGAGRVVEAENNNQLLYYDALMLGENPQIDHFDNIIVQPRAPHPKGPIRGFAISADTVRYWYHNTLVPALKTWHDPNAPLRPGSWCTNCSKALHCPALKGISDEVVKVEHLPVMTNEQLGYRYQLKAPAEAYFKAIAKETTKRALAGQSIPGVKVVRIQSNRQWKEGAPLEPEMYETFPLSPAQVEKKLGRDEFTKEWAFFPDRGYTIANIDDKRKEAMLGIPQWAQTNPTQETK